MNRPNWTHNRSDQYAAVEFEGPSRRVRRVVTGFTYAYAAELYAEHNGWPDYTVSPAATASDRSSDT